MKLVTICVLLGALFSQACTGAIWRADLRFTPEERVDIEHSTELWGEYGHSIFVVYEKVTDQEDSGRYIIRATERTARAHGIDSLAPGRHFAPTLGKEKIVLVPERLKWVPLWEVAAHEFGHSLGLDHVDDPRALMFGGTHKQGVSLQCMTSADIEELCRTAGCVDGLKGCEE